MDKKKKIVRKKRIRAVFGYDRLHSPLRERGYLKLMVYDSKQDVNIVVLIRFKIMLSLTNYILSASFTLGCY